VRRHVALAQEFAAWVQADSRFEIVAPVNLNLICFRLKGDDARSERLLEALNASGKIFLNHTKLNGKLTLRLCIGQASTQRRHVEQVWKLIQEMAGCIGM
jgi:aromatic-L-amino-acid decarboxylase